MLRGLELVAVLDRLDEGLIIATLDGLNIHWNQAALAILELPSDQGSAVSLLELRRRFRVCSLDGVEIPPETSPLNELMRGRDAAPREVLIEARDRPWRRVVRMHGQVIAGTGGGRDLMLIHLTDVTEQHRTAASLAAERARQELLLTAARRLVGVSRLDSPEIEALHGEVMAHAGADILFHGRLRGPRGPLERVFAIGVPDGVGDRPLSESLSGEVAVTGATLVVDADRLARDPRGAHARSLGARAYAGYALRAGDGRVLGTLSFVCTDRDAFTEDESRFLETYSHLVGTAMERIDGEAALRYRDAQLRLILSQAPIILWSTDRELRFTSLGGKVHARIRAAAGAPPAVEPVGQRMADLGLATERHERALAGETVEYDDAHGELSLRCRLVPLRDDAGAVVGTVGVAIDMTDALAAERAIRAANAALEERVAARTAELRAANAELESFAYAVAHDLRAPLRAVAGFTRAVLDDHGAILPADAHAMLDDVIGASHTMSELIDGLLALSRLSRAELVYDPLDLSALAADVIRELSRVEPDRTVAVEIEAGLSARGDRRLVEALLRNLLHNAWKYTAGTAAPTIAMRAEVRGGVRGIAIADNGAGFAMAHAGKLFLPFQRLHRQDEFPGVGLGLATVLRIVRRHGGTIVGTGAPGAGACFWFTLAPAPEAA